jgi:phage-related protein
VFDALAAAFNFVAGIITWWWQNVTMPAINGIVGAFQFFWGLVKPIFDLFWASIQIAGAIVMWLWNNAIVPAFNGIAAVMNWWWSNVVAPVIGFVVSYFQNTLAPIFTWIYQNVIKPAFDGIATVFNWIWSNIIKPNADFIMGAIHNIGDTVSRVFGAIGGIIKGAFNGVVGTVKGVFNNIIDAVNGVIGGINDVGGTLGKALGIDIHVSKLPRLAQGGIVSATPGGIQAVIGEGRYDEAVVPLTPEIKAAFSGTGRGGTTTVYQTVNTQETDGRIIGRQMSRELVKGLAGMTS